MSCLHLGQGANATSLAGHSLGIETTSQDQSAALMEAPVPVFGATLGHCGLRAFGGSSPIHSIQQAQAFPGWITQERSEIDPAVVSVDSDCAQEHLIQLAG